MGRYLDAKEMYAKIGVDTDSAINTLKKVPVALHCWQGDDVRGFDKMQARFPAEYRPPATTRAERPPPKNLWRISITF